MIVGLTGKSCSGKDYFASLLDSDKFFIIDEDEVGHAALEEQKDLIVEAFGDSIITDGFIDRKKLGPVVFSDEEKLEKLNGIVHPWMVDKTLELCSSAVDSGKIAVINAAILEKMGFVEHCNQIVLVVSDYKNRLERALLRDGCTEEAFKRRSESQAEIGSTLFSSGKKLITVFNNGSKENLERQALFYSASI